MQHRVEGGRESLCGTLSLSRKGNVMMPRRQKQIQSLIFSSSSSYCCAAAAVAVVIAACAFPSTQFLFPSSFFEYFSTIFSPLSSLWMPLTDKRWWWWWWWSWYARRVLPFDNNNSRFLPPFALPSSSLPPLFPFSYGRGGEREGTRDGPIVVLVYCRVDCLNLSTSGSDTQPMAVTTGITFFLFHPCDRLLNANRFLLQLRQQQQQQKKILNKKVGSLLTCYLALAQHRRQRRRRRQPLWWHFWIPKKGGCEFQHFKLHGPPCSTAENERAKSCWDLLLLPPPF